MHADELTCIIKSQFKEGGYDVGALNYSEQTKTPFAIQEVLSQGLLNINASDFAGPVLVSTLSVFFEPDQVPKVLKTLIPAY